MRTNVFSFLFMLSFFSWSNEQPVIQVVDYSGNQITLTKPAQRIIALAPHIVENIYSIGAGERIVGTVNYADYPESANTIPRIGNVSSFSVEAIVALKPDIIIAWSSSISPKVVQQFQAFGFPVYLDEPNRLEDIAKSIRHFGVLIGLKEKSELVIAEYLEKLQRLRAAFNQEKTVSVLYQIWHSPLQTINGKHIISDVIQLCGGSNIFSEAKVIAPKISIESVLARDPQVIISTERQKEWIAYWKQWPELRAVNNNHLFTVNPDWLNRHTLRILQGAEQLCKYLTQVREPVV